MEFFYFIYFIFYFFINYLLFIIIIFKSLIFKKSFGISWVLPKTVLDLPFGWWNWLGKHSLNIWNLVPLCLLCCLWKECNRRTFQDLDSFKDQLLAFFSGSLFDWSWTWGLILSLRSFVLSYFVINFLYCFLF